MYTTNDIWNIFRDSLKPAFRLLANRVNEISSDVENIDVTDQLTTLENKFNNKLKEYVAHDELVRDDEVYIFPKVDNEHSVLIFEFGENLVNGLIVFKVFAVNGPNERTRRFYIKIVNGDFVEYKGVEIDTIVNGITIKGLARNEEDRATYMPSAELIMNTTERLISIPFDSNYRLTGAIIEQCTCKRQMVYTPNDIAYIQDIEALNKKIDALAEQSHSNEIQTYVLEDNLREEFATVDEVNTVLTNYVQKKDLPPTVDLSEYYNKTETDNKFALKSDVVNVDLYQYATVDDVNEVLTNYVLKSDFDALKAENDNLKVMIAEINNKLANIYTKDEADNKYLSKENVVNEENYLRTDIKIGDSLKNSGFWFTELSSSEDLRVGFVFSYYDISTPTNPVPVITHKYLFDCENGNCDVYLSEDRTIRIIIQDKIGSTDPSDQPAYFFYLYNIQTSLDITQFTKNEWYFESGYKFDSYNVYCKEIVDEKLAAQ